MLHRTKLIVIAGPSSSGKSTLFNLVGKKYPSVHLLHETNPYTLVGNRHLGGAFVDHSLEIKITEASIKRLKSIFKQNKLIVIESDIFHLSYVKKMCDKKTLNRYRKQFYELYNKLHATIVFIDTKPHISFQRRRPIYLKRVAHKDPKTQREMMNTYRSNIFTMYPLLKELYDELPFEKIMIKNSYKSQLQFLKESLNKIHAILER